VVDDDAATGSTFRLPLLSRLVYTLPLAPRTDGALRPPGRAGDAFRLLAAAARDEKAPAGAVLVGREGTGDVLRLPAAPARTAKLLVAVLVKLREGDVALLLTAAAAALLAIVLAPPMALPPIPRLGEALLLPAAAARAWKLGAGAAGVRDGQELVMVLDVRAGDAMRPLTGRCMVELRLAVALRGGVMLRLGAADAVVLRGGVMARVAAAWRAWMAAAVLAAIAAGERAGDAVRLLDAAARLENELGVVERPGRLLLPLPAVPDLMG